VLCRGGVVLAPARLSGDRPLGVSLTRAQNHVAPAPAKLQVRDRTRAALRMRGL
jgi:hypothetical protein